MIIEPGIVTISEEGIGVEHFHFDGDMARSKVEALEWAKHRIETELAKIVRFRRCFFCGRYMMEKDERHDREGLRKIQEEIGTLPDRVGHEISGKPVCMSCCGDIWSLVMEPGY